MVHTNTVKSLPSLSPHHLSPLSSNPPQNERVYFLHGTSTHEAKRTASTTYRLVSFYAWGYPLSSTMLLCPLHILPHRVHRVPPTTTSHQMHITPLKNKQSKNCSCTPQHFPYPSVVLASELWLMSSATSASTLSAATKSRSRLRAARASGTGNRNSTPWLYSSSPRVLSLDASPSHSVRFHRSRWRGGYETQNAHPSYHWENIAGVIGKTAVAFGPGITVNCGQGDDDSIPKRCEQ